MPESALALGGTTPSPLAAVFRELYVNSRSAEYGFTQQSFATLLTEIGAKYLPADTLPDDAARFYQTLRSEELALARACAAGHEHAWEVFLNRYRAKLYDMAGAIAKEDSAARELAGSLYADLYGLGNREGHRVSKLAYYTGRGSLEGWLRTVLAQEYINRYRTQRRLVSLDEETEDGAQFAAPACDPAETIDAQTIDSRLNDATDGALRSVAAEDRFVLAAYFLDGRTLAEIARMLGVHESTISRKVDKLTKRLREAIVKNLLASGLSRRQAEEALAVDVRDLTVDVRARLAQGTEGAAFNKRDEKT